MSLLNVLKRFVRVELADEGITTELLEMVDLDISYCPVIPFPDGGLDSAVDVRPWGFLPDDVLPEKFEVMHPNVDNPVDRKSLKIMRARYLLARDAYYGPAVHRFFYGSQDGHHSSQTSNRKLPATVNCE